MSSQDASIQEDAIYYPLSKNTQQTKPGTAEILAGQLRQYVTSLMHESKDNDSIFESALGRKVIPLVADKPPIYQEARRRQLKLERKQRVKTPMTSAQRRSSRLFMFPREGLNYEDFIPLNLLWQSYIQDASAGIDLTSRNAVQFSQRLVKIDLHGAFITVTRSKVPSLVGTSGIILYESQETFQIVTLTNKCVTLPKRGSIFLVQTRPMLREASPAAEILAQSSSTGTTSAASAQSNSEKPGFAMTIYGDHFAYRAFDRAVRKFKCLGSITIR